MFVEDYRELRIESAEKIANRCFLFEKFVDDLLTREPQALPFQNSTALNRQVSSERGKQKDRRVNVAIHPHCHAKSILNPAFMKRLVERLPGHHATVLDKLENQGRETQIIASGTSCRHQITDLTNVRPKHMAELLAEALV